MIVIQPTKLLNILRPKRVKLPTGVKRLFYLSWEDALWDILKKKKIPKGSKILVPEFFCGDVEINIVNHGYKVVYYPVDGRLITSAVELETAIKKHKPEVVVVFHHVGIYNQLLENRTWMRSIERETILIEDCVHRIVDPGDLVIYRKNHFIMDSLRKVVPLQGSWVYGLKEDLNWSEPPLSQSWLYALKVYFLWILMILSGVLGQAKLAEKYMLEGYELIGDSKLPARGFSLFSFMAEHINFEKIRKLKNGQVNLYERKLKSNKIKVAPYKDSDKGEMIGWPIILDLKLGDKILKNLRRKDLIIRFELNDSVWSKKHKIIYLPIGPQIRTGDQLRICKIVLESFFKVYNP